MGAVSTCAPHEKLRERKRQFVPSTLWNSEVLYGRRAEQIQIAEAGLPSGHFPNSDLLSQFEFRIVLIYAPLAQDHAKSLAGTQGLSSEALFVC